MLNQRATDISKFFIAGINYRKTDASLRGQFAITYDRYIHLLSLAPQYDVQEMFVLSTCNRTEIYGFTEDASQLSKLLCTQTEGSLESFCEMAYIKSGREAIEHLFN